MAYLGIIFALGALLCWGFGDFFIQRTSRKTGVIHGGYRIDRCVHLSADCRLIGSSDHLIAGLRFHQVICLFVN